MDLINILLKKGKISKDVAKELGEKFFRHIGEQEKFLLSKQIIEEDELLKIKAQEARVDYLLKLPEEIPSDVLDLVPEESAKFYQIVPISKSNGVLEVGVVDPTDKRAIDAIRFLARRINFDYKIYAISYTAFENVLTQYKTIKKEVKSALKELMDSGSAGSAEVTDEDLQKEYSKEIVAEAPINKVVNVILKNAVEGGASDIHIEPTLEKLRVRFRLMGDLHESLLLPIKIHSAVVARIKILSNLRIDETRVPQDGRFSMVFDGKNIDFRVSTFPAIKGEKVVIRVLDPKEGLIDTSSLGFEGRNLKLVQEASKRPYGCILVTGPTGSGKTTTLYSILMNLNREEVNIVTLEDPVEYYVDGINQSQVRSDIGYTFASGLRSILRQDPDVIMVGEIRDGESAELAVHAALTGHIVLSTLHTNNSVGVIPRMLDLGVMPFLLPASISIMISQRLVRVLCEHCKKRTKPPKKIMDMILKEINDFPGKAKKNIKASDIYVWEPVGCKKCDEDGYVGRIGIFEVLEMTPELKKIIVEHPTEENIVKEAKRQGMLTLRQDGIIKALRGITSIEEVLRATTEY